MVPPENLRLDRPRHRCYILPMPAHRSRTAVIIAAAVITAAAAFVAGVLASTHYLGRYTDDVRAAVRTKAASAASGPDFSDQERLRYWKALDQVRYKLLAGPDAPPFEQVVSDEHIRGLIREADKKERLLREHCGIEITPQMVGEEAQRMKSEYTRLDLMARIADALDRDPAAVVAFWIRPILVDRYLRACVAYDPAANAPARQKADELRARALAGDTVGEHWSRAAAMLNSSTVEPEDRAALASLAPGGFSPVIESLSDFHVFRSGARRGDTVDVMKLSVPKPDFDAWLKSQP